ncbi:MULTISPECIES: heme-copper oxidase subunit III [[Limnothrix rosea] IAM M-220]|uniref:cytochrome c oxidase subunit 3 n=1 Tax=[Limnothrix rosea] IAM M-220 TaxID=454133 RepID=UPI000961ECC0|nr:heme-copper oxidase subunit III [[Limnothrix rosea] IAM M-220]
MQSSVTTTNGAIASEYQEAPTEQHGHADYRMLGLVFFLVAETMIFMGLFAAFVIYKVTVPDFTKELELLVPTINSVILVSSSFVMHKGQSAIKNDDVKGLQLWFGLTALMGAVFLGGQVFEYSNMEFGLTEHLFGSCFYVLTGFHGLHVTAGLLFTLAVLWRSREAGHYSSSSHFGVEAAELYWHFVDVVWLVLFLLVYLL